MSIGVVMNAAIEVDIPDTTTPAPVEVGTASLPALLGGGCGGLVGARGSVIVQEWELPRGLTRRNVLHAAAIREAWAQTPARRR